MKDPILQTVKEFLAKKEIDGKNLLLAFSGGPDSLSLLHLLVECKRFFSFTLHVAHVDHGWREESAEETFTLKQEVEKLSLPFHSIRLAGGCQGEERARQERIAYFRALYVELKCTALLLGHQGDDQAETVLKRVLEGASLLSLGGMAPEGELEGMAVWRPLLSRSKKELYAWLEKRGLKPLEDSTNRDPRFLRARMRQEIFPFLTQKFGKEVASNLCKLGETTHQLKNYFTRKIKPYETAVHGSSIDLTPFYPFERVEIHAFFKTWFEKEKVALSHAAFATLLELVEKGKGTKKIVCKGKTVEIRGRVVAIKNSGSYEHQI